MSYCSYLQWKRDPRQLYFCHCAMPIQAYKMTVGTFCTTVQCLGEPSHWRIFVTNEGTQIDTLWGTNCVNDEPTDYAVVYCIRSYGVFLFEGTVTICWIRASVFPISVIVLNQIRIQPNSDYESESSSGSSLFLYPALNV